MKTTKRAQFFWRLGHRISSIGCWLQGGHPEIANELYCAFCGRRKS